MSGSDMAPGWVLDAPAGNGADRTGASSGGAESAGDDDGVVGAEHNHVIEAFMEECGLSLDKVDSMDWEGRLRVVAYLRYPTDNPTPEQLDLECQAVKIEAEGLAVELGLMNPGGEAWKGLLFPNCFVFAVDSVRDANAYLDLFASQFPVCQTLTVSFSKLRADADRIAASGTAEASRNAADSFNAMRSYFFADSDLPGFARQVFARVAAKVGALSHRPRLGAELLPPWFFDASSGVSPLLRGGRPGRERVKARVRGWRRNCMAGVTAWHSDDEWAHGSHNQ